MHLLSDGLMLRSRLIVDNDINQPDFAREHLLKALVVTRNCSVMPVGVDFSFETVLCAIYALCHGTIAYSTHESNRAVRDLFIELLHAAIEFQSGVLQVAGSLVYVGRAVHVHVNDGIGLILQAELEYTPQGVPAKIGDGELLTLDLRQ